MKRKAKQGQGATANTQRATKAFMNLPIRPIFEKYKLYLYVGLGYTLIACVVNYPFIRHFFTALPSTHEDWYVESDIYYFQ